MKHAATPDHATLALIAAALLSAWPSVASAQQTLAELTVGLGARRWTGAVGERLRPGVGFEIEQKLYLVKGAEEASVATRHKWMVGAGVKLAAFSYVARASSAQDEPPSVPFNSDWQSYHAQIGPRLQYRIWRGAFTELSVDYARIGGGGSALVEQVGLERSWRGVATSARLGYSLEPLVVEFEAIAHAVPGLKSALFGAMVRVGIANF